MIKRIFDIANMIKPGKVLVIYGPRRVGKTTLLKDFLDKSKLKYKLDSGDNIRTQEIFNAQVFSEILPYAEGYELLAIDEAQQIKNIGMGLKILVDNLPDITIIATGSSSFELSQQIGEPLTGRKRTISLFPFSQEELLSLYNKHELKERLEEFLIYGSYPEVITAGNCNEKREVLVELVNSYLLKDIFTLERIKGTKQIFDLLKLIAFQVGNEVSLNELASQVKLDVKTVGKYLDLLEKAFILYKRGAFSRNLRNEITTKSRYYFWDNGIRNGIVLQFNSLSERNDTGALFENFFVIERLKYLHNNSIYRNLYFWRTYSGYEVDIIEEGDGKLLGLEVKFSPRTKLKPNPFTSIYQNSSIELVNRENYLDYLT
ncbi:MAG TPA: ATP-binding protein [Ignavibacteriaceae bacterium]|jgi:predicted AAA+ superfamily ATPase|nr:ATP-binding protein [Ignavibacteriaceae bacterium]